MNMKHFALAGAVVLASFGAHAVTVGEVSGAVNDTLGATTFDLSPSNVAGGILTTTSIDGYAVAPGLNAPGAYFLAGEPVADGGAATVTLGAGVDFVSFDWATPDDYNTLLVTLSDNSVAAFQASTLGLTIGDDRYVNFAVDGGLTITSLTFESTTLPAFEAGNFSVTTVPEPANVMLMLAGLGMLGALTRRRKS